MRSELMASTVLTKASACVGRAARTRWRLAGQHRAGIHCSIAINGVRDGRQEARRRNVSLCGNRGDTPSLR